MKPSRISEIHVQPYDEAAACSWDDGDRRDACNHSGTAYGWVGIGNLGRMRLNVPGIPMVRFPARHGETIRVIANRRTMGFSYILVQIGRPFLGDRSGM